MTKKQPGRGVQSVDVAGRLLRVLASASGPLMLKDIASGAELPPGQAHAYLVSFRNMALVEQDAATGKYHLGPFALRLGLARVRHYEPLQIIWDAVPAFAEAADLMVTMSIWSEHGPVIMRVYEAPFQIYSNIRTGAVYSLTTTATGRLFAAFSPPAVVEPLVKEELRKSRQAGDAERQSLAEYRVALEKIRREHCSWTEGRPVPGISAVSAPVFDLNEQLVAAITIIGPKTAIDCTPNGRQRLELLTFTKDLSARLGYPG
jgi:DNA-binding IclR family transcriptional regulator